MTKPARKMKALSHNQLQKCATGIKGFDQITAGGLPKNRTTLICGSTGSGKTLFGIDFIIEGAIKYNEPGVFMSFEETEDELYKDVASLNMDLRGLVSQKKILLEYVLLERRDIQESDFNLEEYLFVWNMPLIQLAPNALFWIPLNLSLLGSQMSAFFA